MELAFCFRKVGWQAQAALLLFTVLALGACGGGGSKPAVVPPPSPPPASVLISGSEAALVSAVLGTTSDGPLPSAEVSSGFLLSRLLVSFKSDATVGQVNAAARAIGATRITSSEPGSLLVVLEVPRQANVAGIQLLAKTLRAQPGVALAVPGQTAKPSVLPQAAGGVAVPASSLSHLLANRFPQAWNARQTIGSECFPLSVQVYVLDMFGPVTDRPAFFDQIDRVDFVPDPNGVAEDGNGHGYDVISTMAAKFDADAPTGANPFPDCMGIHAIEQRDAEYLDGMRRALHAVAAKVDTRVILTSSMNFPDVTSCGPELDQPCDAQTIATARQLFVTNSQFIIAARVAIAGEWSRLIRTLDLQDKLLVVQSAGNVEPELPEGFLPQNYLGFRSASFSSPPALATHIGNLQAMLTSSLWEPSTDPSLPNVAYSAENAARMIQANPSLDPAATLDGRNLLIVDSGTNVETHDEVRQSSFDYLGADVRAVGEGIVLATLIEKGTSLATAEVAGLAAYLWNLSPALANAPGSATVDLIKRTSTTTASSANVPVIDAYAAVLQLDDVPGCCGGAKFAPMRLGLVDVDGDGGFTGLDLQQFADAYGLADPNTPTIPSARDFSRFDLNGDGFTGGIITTAFDLDVNGLDANGRANINATDETVEGYRLTFNEAALSDLQILCYYAYSLLYTSDDGGQNDQLRTSLLGPDRCVGLRLDVQFPAEVSSSSVLSAVVEVPVGNGQLAPAPNMLIELTPACATVSPTSVRTDTNGTITATVTPSAGCGSISIHLVARADAGTTALAQQVVSATVAALPLPSGYTGTWCEVTPFECRPFGANTGGALSISGPDPSTGQIFATVPCGDRTDFQTAVFAVTITGDTITGFQAFPAICNPGVSPSDTSLTGTFSDSGCSLNVSVTLALTRNGPVVERFSGGTRTFPSCQ